MAVTNVGRYPVVRSKAYVASTGRTCTQSAGDNTFNIAEDADLKYVGKNEPIHRLFLTSVFALSG